MRETSQTGPKLVRVRLNGKRACELEPPEGPRMAKTLKRAELENDEEPAYMEDDTDEDLAEAVCRVAWGSISQG